MYVYVSPHMRGKHTVSVLYANHISLLKTLGYHRLDGLVNHENIASMAAHSGLKGMRQTKFDTHTLFTAEF